MEFEHPDYAALFLRGEANHEAIHRIRDKIRGSDDLMAMFNLLVFAHSFAEFRHADEFEGFLRKIAEPPTADQLRHLEGLAAGEKSD